MASHVYALTGVLTYHTITIASLTIMLNISAGMRQTRVRIFPLKTHKAMRISEGVMSFCILGGVSMLVVDSAPVGCVTTTTSCGFQNKNCHPDVFKLKTFFLTPYIVYILSLIWG